jgi:hypothetical protein
MAIGSVVESEPISVRQSFALKRLMAGDTVKDAARRSGIGYSTLRKWMAHDAAFRDALVRGRRALMEATLSLAHAVSEKAVGCLVDSVDGKPISPQQIRAAGMLIDLAVKASERFDVLGELEALRKLVYGESPERDSEAEDSGDEPEGPEGLQLLPRPAG